MYLPQSLVPVPEALPSFEVLPFEEPAPPPFMPDEPVSVLQNSSSDSGARDQQLEQAVPPSPTDSWASWSEREEAADSYAEPTFDESWECISLAPAPPPAYAARTLPPWLAGAFGFFGDGASENAKAPELANAPELLLPRPLVFASAHPIPFALRGAGAARAAGGLELVRTVVARAGRTWRAAEGVVGAGEVWGAIRGAAAGGDPEKELAWGVLRCARRGGEVSWGVPGAVRVQYAVRLAGAGGAQVVLRTHAWWESDEHGRKAPALSLAPR